MEKHVIEGLLFHNTCFKCTTCGRKLGVQFSRNGQDFYCGTHYAELFKLRGRYDFATGDKGPGSEKVSESGSAQVSESGSAPESPVIKASDPQDEAVSPTPADVLEKPGDLMAIGNPDKPSNPEKSSNPIVEKSSDPIVIGNLDKLSEPAEVSTPEKLGNDVEILVPEQLVIPTKLDDPENSADPVKNDIPDKLGMPVEMGSPEKLVDSVRMSSPEKLGNPKTDPEDMAEAAGMSSPEKLDEPAEVCKPEKNGGLVEVGKDMP